MKCKHSEKECRTCSRNRRRKESVKLFLSDLWGKIKNRCNDTTTETNLKYYYGKEYCNKMDFINYFIKDKKFLLLHKKWVKNGCIYKETPSIDRIDKNKDYHLDNLQFITHSENAGKDKEKLPVLMYDLNGNFIKEWESKWKAHLELKIPNGNIVKVCYGKRKSAGGYVWKFK